jgi:hypothetical protein
MHRHFIATIALLASCFAPAADIAGDTDYMPEDPPAGNCGETNNDPCTSTGVEAEDGCSATLPCDAGLFCAASFDGDIGRFDCRDACVPDMDDTRWCFDDAACCNAGSVCQGRGYCVPSGATSTGLDPDTGADTGTDTGTDAGSSTSMGTGDTSTSTTDGSTTDTGTTGAANEPERRPIRR